MLKALLSLSAFGSSLEKPVEDGSSETRKSLDTIKKLRQIYMSSFLILSMESTNSIYTPFNFFTQFIFSCDEDL